MARVWQLLLKADGDTAAASREMRKLQKDVRKFGNGMKNVGRNLTAAVTAPIVALGVLGVQELRETMVVTKKTDAVFKSMGKSMKVTRGDLDKLVGSLESYSAIEGDIIQNAANVGLSFKALAGNPKLFEDTMKAAVDMSAALGTDLQTTMVQLGKAMQNGAKGAGALSKNGTLAKDDIAKLQKMAKDGVPIWKQQAFILDAVNKQYAGQGKNVDPVKALTVAVKNIAESLAVLLLPSIVKVSEWLQKLAKYVDGLSAEKKKWIGVALALAAVLGPLLIVVGSLVTASAALIPVIVAIGAPVLAAAAAGLVFWGVLGALYVKSETFRKAVNALIGVLMRNKQWLLALVSPAGMVIALLVSLYFGVKKLAEVIMSVLRPALAWVRDNAAAAWSAVNRAVDRAGDLARSFAGVVSGAVKSALGWVRDNAAAAWSAVNGALDTARDRAQSLGSALTGAVKAGLSWVRDNGGAAWSAFKSAADSVRSVLRDIANAVDSIRSGLEKAVSLAGKVKVPGSGVLSKLPGFARGGITSGLSFAGEAGPEAVIPLGSSAQNRADRSRVMSEAGLTGLGGRGVQIHMTVNKNVDEEMIVRKVMRELGSRRVMMGGLA